MKRFFVSCLLALGMLAGARGGTETPPPMEPARQLPEANFAAGAREFQSVLGYFAFFDTTQNNRPSIDYSLATLRLGIMLNNPWSLGVLSGNFELLGEVFAGPVVQGPGDVLAGASLVFRYNFVQPQAKIIPYAQIVGGGVYTDIPENESHGLISLPVEFNLQAALGSRFMLNDHWSLVVEAAYRHISNAEIKKPNYGIDSVGGNVGFGFSF